jgi:hypothetical protein
MSLVVWSSGESFHTVLNSEDVSFLSIDVFLCFPCMCDKMRQQELPWTRDMIQEPQGSQTPPPTPPTHTFVTIKSLP